MRRPPPEDGDGLNPAAPEGLAVLHAQGVVGPGQRVPLRDQAQKGPLAGGGKGIPFFQLFPEGFRESAGAQRLRAADQGRGVPALAAEDQMADGPRGLQYFHGPGGEALRRGEGPGNGQLQHQIRPAPYGGGGPGVLARRGKVPPLDVVPAHDAEDPCLRPQEAAGLRHQVDVAHMKGIVFCNDTSGGHKIPP